MFQSLSHTHRRAGNAIVTGNVARTTSRQISVMGTYRARMCCGKVPGLESISFFRKEMHDRIWRRKGSIVHSFSLYLWLVRHRSESFEIWNYGLFSNPPLARIAILPLPYHSRARISSEIYTIDVANPHATQCCTLLSVFHFLIDEAAIAGSHCE
jgi:hypothetical protein